MMIVSIARRAAASLLLSGCFAIPAFGQQPVPKDVAIRIIDSSGAAIVSANVLLQDSPGQNAYPLQIDQGREYRLPLIPAETYSIIVEAPGFAKAQQIVELSSATTYPLTVILQVAGNQSTIAVTDRDLRDEAY